MHSCFHGGGGTIKSIGIIRDLAKNMKAMSLKVKAGGGGGGGSYARRRRGRPAEAEEDLQLQDKDIAAASASASAKIVPAQTQEADGDHDPPPASSSGHHPLEEEQGGKRQVHCDKCCSPLEDGAKEEAVALPADHTTAEERDREWVAEPEPGVLMTLVSRPDGTNALRSIRFREELFDGPRAAQRWWADNYDSIVELYSVVQSERSPEDDEEEAEDSAPVTPCQSEDDDHRRQHGCDSGSTFSGPSSSSGGGSTSTLGSPILGLVVTTPNSGTVQRKKELVFINLQKY